MNNAAYRSAIAHPYHVSLYPNWSLASWPPLTVGFQTEAEARAFAASRPEPLIDLFDRDTGRIIAQRRVLAHPSDRNFQPRDDFPNVEPSPYPEPANGSRYIDGDGETWEVRPGYTDVQVEP